MKYKFHVFDVLLFLSAAVDIPFSMLVYGFNSVSPFTNPRDVIPSNKFVSCEDRKVPHKVYGAIYMKSIHENDESPIAQFRHPKKSTFQSIRIKWRKSCLKNTNEDNLNRKRHRIAAIATFLFAWASPRTALLKVSHSPIIAHADTTTSPFHHHHRPSAAILKAKKHGPIEVKQANKMDPKKSMVRNTLLFTATGTGFAIGQVANAKLYKRIKNKKGSVTHGEEEFNEIMGINSTSNPEVKEETNDESLELGIDEITQVTADIIPLQNFQLGAGIDIDIESASSIMNETPKIQDEENKEIQTLKQKNIMEVSARISAEEKYKKIQTELHQAREAAKSAVEARDTAEAKLKEKDEIIRNMEEEMKVSTATKRAALALATANEEALSKAEEKNKTKDKELSKTQAEHDVILTAAEALYGADKSALDKASREITLAKDAMAVARVKATIAEETLQKTEKELKKERLLRSAAEARARAGEEDFQKLQKRIKAEVDARASLEKKSKRHRDAEAKKAKVDMKKESKELDKVISERDAAINAKSVLENKVHQQENALYKAELKAKAEERARRTAEAMEKVIHAAIEAGNSAHETALHKAEDKLEVAMKEKVAAEAMAKEAEKRLGEEMERANSEARARATAEAISMAGEEDYRKLKMRLKAEINSRNVAEKRSRNLESKMHEMKKMTMAESFEVQNANVNNFRNNKNQYSIIENGSNIMTTENNYMEKKESLKEEQDSLSETKRYASWLSGAFDELEKKAEEFKDIFHVSKEKKKIPKH